MLYFNCLLDDMKLFVSLTQVPWVGLQCVIVTFPVHTHSFFGWHFSSAML